MKLSRKIQKSMLFAVMLTLGLAYASFVFIIYNQAINLAKSSTAQEASYVKKLIKGTHEKYINAIDLALPDTRITIISPDGVVLYDSNTGIAFENHLQRPEVQQAIHNGFGQDIRLSDSLKAKLLYYAELLDDGNILRIAKSFDSVFSIAIRFLPFVLGTGLFMFGFAYIFAKMQTAKITKPINAIDLNNPLSQKNYDEIIPLLARIEKQNLEQQALDRMRREFSANVSHELKTPLTTITGYAEIIKTGLAKPEDIGKFSEKIHSEAIRLLELIDAIMLISKLDEEKVPQEKQLVNIFQLAVDICNRLQKKAEEKQIHINLTGEPTSLLGIPFVLDEMLYNIIDNAIKYNKENGTVNIWIGTMLGTKKIIIEDTGIGIDKKYHDRIFERFFRVDSSHSTSTGGSGLGLSIVKHAAQIHNLSIELESEESKGTKITLIFMEQ